MLYNLLKLYLPQTVLIRLGADKEWTINGPTSLGVITFKADSSLATTIQKQICKACSNIVDAYSDDKAPSEYDQKFFRSAENSVRKQDDGH